MRQFKWALSSRQIFEWQKMTRPETLTDIQRAARFFYLQHHAFGGKVSGQSFGTATTAPAINLLRIEENLSAAWQRLSGTYVENLPCLNAPKATTGRIPSITWTHLTGRLRATVLTYRSTTTNAWLNLYCDAKASLWSVSTINRTFSGGLKGIILRRPRFGKRSRISDGVR